MLRCACFDPSVVSEGRQRREDLEGSRYSLFSEHNPGVAAASCVQHADFPPFLRSHPEVYSCLVRTEWRLLHAPGELARDMTRATGHGATSGPRVDEEERGLL